MGLILLHTLIIRGLRIGKVHLPPSLLFERKKTHSSDSIFVLAFLVCLGVCFWVSLVVFVFVCWFFFFNKKKEKSKKYKNNVCLYILVLSTLDGHWKKVEKLCITCSLDEHPHAQLSNVSFVARFCDLYDLVNLLSFITLSLFLTGMTKKF